MKKIKFFILFYMSLGLFLACQNTDGQQNKSNINSTNNQNNYDELATTYCNCSSEIIALNKKMQKLHDEGNFEEMGDLLSEIEAKSAVQATCQQELEAKFNTKIDTSKAVLAAIKKVCPDLGGFIENAKKEAE